MDEVLNLPSLDEEIQGGSMLNGYPAPEDLFQGVIRVLMEISPGQFRKTIHTKHLLMMEQRIAASIAEAWIKQGNKVSNK
jgi:hypothetical protein